MKSMDVLAFAEVRVKLKSVIDRVVRNRAPVIISRRDGEPVVMISSADWKAVEETTYILSQKANADRLNSAIATLNG